MNNNENAQKTQANVSSMPQCQDFDGFGQGQILMLLREIKQLSQNHAEVSEEYGDMLWRKADRAQQIIESREVNQRHG